MKKLYTPPVKKYLLTFSMFALLPAFSTAIADIDDRGNRSDKERNQIRGYLGEVSQEVIETGMLERLEENMELQQREFLDGVEIVDLKARVAFWHGVALDTVALDHTSVGDDGAPANQGGPTRTSRALACLLYTSPSPRDS